METSHRTLGMTSSRKREEPCVLWEDNHGIVVFKPHGLLVQGNSSGDSTLLDWTKYWLKQKYHKQGKVFLGLVHRLDRTASGIVLLAKTSKGASRFSEQFRGHQVEKTYLALVEGSLKKSQGKLRHSLLSEEYGSKVGEGKDAKNAELEYEVIENLGNRSLLKIRLITGRKHQIRVQFSHEGHPLLGDRKYGSQQPFLPGAIALVASRLEFNTATSGERVTIELPEELNSLRGKN